MAQNVQPIFILPEGYNRKLGKEAQKNNIMAAKMVAETVRTTLGPKGMDKMLVDSIGEVTITNDGVTILQEMEIDHPAAKMMVEIAKTQEEEIGDGTTTAVVIAGELLKRSEDLLEQNIHPSVISKGFSIASAKALELLEELGHKVSIEDKKMMEKIAVTAMTGKSATENKEKLAKLIVEAVTSIVEEEEKEVIIDKDNIKLEKKTGGSIEDSELIKGILIDKEIIHPAMPKKVKQAKVLLLEGALEAKETETDTQIRISSPEQLQAFIEREERTLKGMVDKVKSTGANVVFSQKGIDDLVQHLLAKAGIVAVRRVKKSDMEKLALATGGKIVGSVKNVSSDDLGNAGAVEEQKIAGESMTFVKDCKNPKAVTILIRGGSEHIIDEIERAVTDAIGDVIALVKDKKVVAGGGAPEMEISRELAKFAKTLSGKEQLAVMAFAHSLEIIPRTLAENAGIDPVDILADLKAKHEAGAKWAGVDVYKGKVSDMWEQGVIEPLKIKTQAISSASEVATMILRIDDVIAAGKGTGMPMPPQGMGGGMPPGMGGMPETM